MIAELLCSLVAYLLFAPSIVALRGPLSHQTHFLASSERLVSLHLTPAIQMSSLTRALRRKRLQGHWLPLHTFNRRKPPKIYSISVLSAHVFSHSFPASGVTVD